MPAIPAWLYQLIKLAIQIGSPYLLSLIQKWVKTLPSDIVKIITDLINAIKNPAVSNSMAQKIAMARFHECVGTACPPDLKGKQ